jgi:hypothetical protein
MPASSYFDYWNPDPRCDYPFEPCAVGHCWSYAHHIDGTKGFESMEKICPRCEYFRPQLEAVTLEH